VRFNTPLYLWVCIFVLPFLIWYWRNVLQIGEANTFKKSSLNFFLKSLALISLLLALAAPFTERRHDSSSATVLLDISDSISPRAANLMLAELRELAGSSLPLDIHPFAKDYSSSGFSLSGLDTFETAKSSYSKLDSSGTDLGRALEKAQFLGASNLILISDGHSNKGDFSHSLASLKANGIKIFPLVTKQEIPPDDELGVSNLFAPMLSAAHKSVDIRTTLKNSTSAPETGVIEIVHDKKIVLSKEVTLDPNSEKLFVAPSDPSLEGIKRITATFTPKNSKYSSTNRTIFLSGETREKILMLSGSEVDQRFLSEALKSQAYQVEALNAEAGLSSLPSFSDFSAVIFNNVGIKQLPSSASILIEKYVKEGGGFLMIGGNKSFGLGGYKDTEIEQALPVKLVPPQTSQKRLNIAVELVLDKSRSMADANKEEYTKEAAREVVRNLKEDDLVGVIGFDSAPFEVVRLGPLSETRDQALERIGRLFPSGKTNLMPAMDEARRRLEQAPAGRKHMIILTDGQLPDAGQYYIELVKQLRLVGITVSTVLVGDEPDIGLLQNMGEVGGGAFYRTEDPSSLPRIFISDIKVSSGEQTLKENQEYLVRTGSDGVLSTEIRSFPPLRGYVQTGIKNGASLELVAFAADRAEPLLASWNYGKGKAIAFTSDANGRWSNYWVSWPKFLNFWDDIIESLRVKKGENSESVKFELRHYLDGGDLVLDLSLYSADASGDISATLKLPNSKEQNPVFTKMSRGHFQARIESPQAGDYEFAANVSGRKLTAVAFNLSSELFGERHWRGFNLPTLQKLASETGGKINPTLQDLREQNTVAREKYDLSQFFFGLAILFLLAEIILREIPQFRRRLIFKALP